jgi:hypothetical protein
MASLFAFNSWAVEYSGSDLDNDESVARAIAEAQRLEDQQRREHECTISTPTNLTIPCPGIEAGELIIQASNMVIEGAGCKTFYSVVLPDGRILSDSDVVALSESDAVKDACKEKEEELVPFIDSTSLDCSRDDEEAEEALQKVMALYESFKQKSPPTEESIAYAIEKQKLRNSAQEALDSWTEAYPNCPLPSEFSELLQSLGILSSPSAPIQPKPPTPTPPQPPTPIQPTPPTNPIYKLKTVGPRKPQPKPKPAPKPQAKPKPKPKK